MMLTLFNFGKLFIPQSTNLKISQTKLLKLLHVLQVAAASPVSAAPDGASLFLRCPAKNEITLFVLSAYTLIALKL